MHSVTCGNTILGSMQKWHIGNDVRTILLNNSEIVERVGNDIFPLVAPEGTEGAFIIYQRDKYTKTWGKMGVTEDTCHLLLIAIADNYDLALDLAELIDNALTGRHTNDFGENFTMNLIDSTEAFEDDKYVETLLFEIK